MKRIVNTMFVLFIIGAQLGHAADQAAAPKRTLNKIQAAAPKRTLNKIQGVVGFLSWAQERSSSGVRENLCPFGNCPTEGKIKATGLQMHLSKHHPGWDVAMRMEEGGASYKRNNMLKPWRERIEGGGQLFEEYNSQTKTFSWILPGDSKHIVAQYYRVQVAKSEGRKKISQMRDFYRQYAAIICNRPNIRDIDKEEFLKYRGKDRIKSRIVYLEYLLEHLEEQDYETYIGSKVREKDASFSRENLNELAQKEIDYCKKIALLRCDDEIDGRRLKEQRKALRRLLESGFQAQTQRKVYLSRNLTMLHLILNRIETKGAQVFTYYTHTFRIDVPQDKLKEKVEQLIAQGKDLYSQHTGKDFVFEQQDSDHDEVSDSDDDSDDLYQGFLEDVRKARPALTLEEVDQQLAALCGGHVPQSYGSVAADGRKREMLRILQARKEKQDLQQNREKWLELIREKTAQRKRKSQGNHA